MSTGPEYVDSREIFGLTWYQTKETDELGSQIWVRVGDEVASAEMGTRFDVAKNAAAQFLKEGLIVTSALLLPRETRIRVVPTSENA